MNEVLEETGPLALSVPVTLEHYGGAVTETRGALARMGQSESELEKSAFSDSDWCCWCPEPANRETVEYLEANDARWRVLDTDTLGGGIGTDSGRRTVRYMLIHEQAAMQMDFDPADYAVADFN